VTQTWLKKAIREGFRGKIIRDNGERVWRLLGLCKASMTLLRLNPSLCYVPHSGIHL